jgi:HCO3- transporter family
MPVVSGIFLYLGRKVMSGNEFLSRIKELVADRTMLTPCSAVTRVGYKTAASYTLVQVSVTNVLIACIAYIIHVLTTALYYTRHSERWLLCNTITFTDSLYDIALHALYLRYAEVCTRQFSIRACLSDV